MWFFKKDKRSLGSLAIEARGERLFEKFIRSPHKEPWVATFILLAWTAGPVSILALVGGYYIGYGNLPPLDRTLYIISYAGIAGILGFAARLIISIVNSRKQQEESSYFLEVVDCLPELVYMVRDLRLENLNDEARRITAAGLLLRKMDLTPDSVFCAIHDLTKDVELARSVSTIELYRRAGLYNRMQDIVNEIKPSIDALYKKLKQNYPAIAEDVLNRLQGHVSSVRKGVSREPLFIERILAAIEQQKEELITLADVEEILILCFELLCNRHIVYLQMKHKGDWGLAKSLDMLEKNKNNFRISQARVYSRLRALTTYLNYVELKENIQSSPKMNSRALLDFALEAMTALTNSVSESRRTTFKTGKQIVALQIKTMHLEKAVSLYSEVRKAYEQQIRDAKRFGRALKVWQLRSKQYKNEGKGRSLKRGLRISEQQIYLDSEEIIEASKLISSHLKEARIRLARNWNDQTNEKNSMDKRLTITRARELAIEITLILEPFVKLQLPERQRAIDSTHASNLSTIELGMSPMAKASLGKGIAGAVEKNLAAMAERLAQNLVRYYRIPLTDDMINFLHQTYGASKERLNFIAQHEKPVGSQYSASQKPILEIKKPDYNWQIALNNAHGTLHRAIKKLSD